MVLHRRLDASSILPPFTTIIDVPEITSSLSVIRILIPAADFMLSLSSTPFFDGLVSYLTSGPIVALILEGDNAIISCRNLAGTTDGSRAAAGTIRGDFSLNIEENIVHASDSPEAYNHEYKIFFNENEIMDY